MHRKKKKKNSPRANMKLYLIFLINYSITRLEYVASTNTSLAPGILGVNINAVFNIHNEHVGASCGSDGKESTCNEGDWGSIPGWGRSLGEGSGFPLQYSCLENSMDRKAWQATVHGVAKSWTHLSN